MLRIVPVPSAGSSGETGCIHKYNHVSIAISRLLNQAVQVHTWFGQRRRTDVTKDQDHRSTTPCSRGSNSPAIHFS